MTFLKKIGLGTILVLLLLAAGTFFGSHKALAATPDFNLKFSDGFGRSIDGTYDNAKITFTSIGTDSQKQYAIYKDSAINAGDPFAACGSQAEIFVPITPASQGAAARGNVQDFKYMPTGSSACATYSDSQVGIAAWNGTKAAPTKIDWSGATGVMDTLGKQVVVTLNDNSTVTFVDSKIDNVINLKPNTSDTGKNVGGIVVTSWCQNTNFGSTDKNYGLSLSSYSDTTGSLNLCYNNDTGQVTQTATISPIDTSAYVPPGGGTANYQSVCENSYTGGGKELGWIFCPVLRGMDGIIGFLDDQIQGQLFVCTGTSATTGQSCSNSILTDKGSGNVKQVWSVFRILATSLLVIIMLVMVIAQAIGGGPIDAYTIRKVLPKLVIAAIFMQISWYVFKFAIDISNDAGRGIADLMFYPFGGTGNFALDNLVGGAGKWAPSVTVTGAALTTGLLVAFGGLTSIGWVFLGISMVASLFTGMLLLVFRRLLIILLMMTVPLALVAWILPGTKRYWDMWKDNFTKLIFMFPMIMAMIAAGRIFALLGSRQGGFSGLIIVLVGYFGPYFFLPKTFKWGGQAFSAAANGAWNATKQYRNAPGKFALGMAKENRAYRALERNQRIARDPSKAGAFDKLLAGRYNYARERKRRGQTGPGALMSRYAQTVAEGQEAGRKAVAQELLVRGFNNWDHERKKRAMKAWVEGGAAEGLSAENNEALVMHAAKTLIDLGDTDLIRDSLDNGGIDASTWLKIRAENFGALNQETPDLGLFGNMTKLSADRVPNMKSHSIKELVKQVEEGYVRENDEFGNSRKVYLTGEDREQQKVDGAALSRQIMGNQLTMGRLDADGQARIRSLATAGGTQASVFRGEGGRRYADIPQGGMLRAPAADAATEDDRQENTRRQAARSSVLTSLVNPDEAGPVATRIAETLVGGRTNPGSVDAEDMEGLGDFIGTLRASAGTSPQMKAAFDSIQQAINVTLQEHISRVEVGRVAGGSGAAADAAADARTMADAIRAELGVDPAVGRRVPTSPEGELHEGDDIDLHGGA